MGKMWEFVKMLCESEFSIDIPQKVINHYYITIDNRKVEVTADEFRRMARQNLLKGNNNILIEDRR